MSDGKASLKKVATVAFLVPALHSALAVMKDNSLLLHASPLLQRCELYGGLSILPKNVMLGMATSCARNRPGAWRPCNAGADGSCEERVLPSGIETLAAS